MLREDSIKPLRDAVAHIRQKPLNNEVDFRNQIGIYEKVLVKGFTFSTNGIAVRVSFSTNRAEKSIRWEMSKRLITGTIVALTPAQDMFQKQCIVAVVAARPLTNLELNPPELDLYFADCSDLTVQPHDAFVMVEGRTGFYEAHRHTMKALQHMSKESFPLSKHLVLVKPNVGPPDYLEGDRRKMDLSGIFSSPPDLLQFDEIEIPQTSLHVDILTNWPATDTELFDRSQQAAIRRILTKRLALVQGPPGTGKTHISVAALKALLQNTPEGAPPILISCQTNHALDQILRQVADFEPRYARIGAFSKDPDIRQRTTYSLRDSVKSVKIAGDLWRPATKQMESIVKELQEDLGALDPEYDILDSKLLLSKGLISQGQLESLEKGATEWIQGGTDVRSPLELWLGKDLVPVHGPERLKFTFDDFEDPETEMEELKENEAENGARDDDEFGTLTGPYVCVAHSKTSKKIPVPPGRQKDFDKLFRAKNLWQIPQSYRGHVYRVWLDTYKQIVSQSLQIAAESLIQPVQRRRTGRWERDFLVLQRQRVIGMTTTGLSKYRALITALKPQTILIEEAGESLEGSVASACVPSLQQLILVGDHQQLRPQCHVQLHGQTLNMKISLFERLINNRVEYDILTQQRRMIPEIRSFLHPIYGDILKDHTDVTQERNRPPVKGMGGLNTFFFDHEWSETKDANLSFVNYQEAKMVAGFFDYLCRNGEGVGKITVLTFYSGQRKEIDHLIRCSDAYLNQTNQNLEVRTVDSYQGEEKDIIILALARYGSGNIGFLGNINRICVAMSRARRGLYIFGNSKLLRAKSDTWAQILDIMETKASKTRPWAKTQPRVGKALPITCDLHQDRTLIRGKLTYSMREHGLRLIRLFTDPLDWLQRPKCGH